MKRLITTICLSTFLVGCSLTPPGERIDVHPQRPDAIGELKAKWEVKEINGEAWVGMPYVEFQDSFRPWMNDLTRYLRGTNDMLCYYRAPLKEVKCETK